MLRKLGLALFAVAILVAGSTGISTSASARGWHGGGGGWHGGGGGWHGGGGWRGGGWNGGGWRGGGFHRGWGGPRFYGGWGRPRFYGGWGPRFYGGPVFYGAYGGCVVRRWVPTPWGWRVRWVNRCF